VFLPKSFFVFSAGVNSARTARRLKRTDDAVSSQHRTLRFLIGRYASTEIGRKSGLEKQADYESFRSRIPLRGYQDFAPYVERMKRGERDVLWPGQCSLYAVSAGTTDSHPKYLPVTEEMLQHFRKAGLASVMFYSSRTGNSRVFRGRHLFLGGSTALTPLREARSSVAFAGDLSGITDSILPAWVARHFHEPGVAISQMADWPTKIEAIVERSRPLDITLVAGMPNWLLILAQALVNSGDHHPAHPHLQSLWPNLECIVHGGVPLAPFQEELRRAVGPKPNFHEVYRAGEGFIAAQDSDAIAGMRLMADLGLFFEFLPLSHFNSGLLPTLGSKAVPLEGVRIGEDYALVVSTPAGLCRYVMGDVVRFISTKPARLIYVGQTKLQLSAFGEYVIEKEITDALVAVCRRHNWSITNFHVAPLVVSSLTGTKRGRHEWWIELRSGTTETPTGPSLAGKLDLELMTRNGEYESKRKNGVLEPPVVRLVMPGFFEHWMKHHEKWGGQNKMPRCRSDRLIADEFSQIACFTED
jgi:hypothetical protein